MPSKTVFLLRHGEIDSGGERRFVGQVDLPLTDEGLSQAAWWNREFSKVPVRHIWSSDLSRCLRTAQTVAGPDKDRITAIPELREISLGAWDGLTLSEVQRRFPGEIERRLDNLAEYRPDGGESYRDLSRRAVSVFEDIVRQIPEAGLIVAHSGVNRVILCHVLGMPVSNVLRLVQDYASLNIIEVHKEGLHLRAMNLRPYTTKLLPLEET